MDNDTRAGYARAALDTLPDQNEDTATKITDMLTNLMHLATHLQIDFDSCLSMATDHFSEERDDQTPKGECSDCGADDVELCADGRCKECQPMGCEAGYQEFDVIASMRGKGGVS